MNQEIDYLVKVLTIGESGVGKTCLVQRYIKNKFSEHHLSTIAIDFKMKILQINKNKIKMQLWDTAGQERFNTLTSSFFRGSDGIILCFSVTSKKSFKAIDKWMDQVRNLAPVDVRVVLVGNKVDLEGREVSNQEASLLAEKYGIEYFEASAKLGSGVETVFERIAGMVLEKVRNGERRDGVENSFFEDGGEGRKKRCC